MILDKEESDVLGSICEGMNDLHASKWYTGYDKDKLKKIYNSLEKKGMIVINKKYDDHYKEDDWDAKPTEKGSKYFMEKVE